MGGRNWRNVLFCVICQCFGTGGWYFTVMCAYPSPGGNELCALQNIMLWTSSPPQVVISLPSLPPVPPFPSEQDHGRPTNWSACRGSWGGNLSCCRLWKRGAQEGLVNRLSLGSKARKLRLTRQDNLRSIAASANKEKKDIDPNK